MNTQKKILYPNQKEKFENFGNLLIFHFLFFYALFI